MAQATRLLRHCWLARISHHLATANRDLLRSAEFPPIGLLDILLSMPPRPSGRECHNSQHLSALATRRGEKCGLVALLLSGTWPSLAADQAVVDPAATPETRALNGALLRIMGEGMLFGHQHTTCYGIDPESPTGRWMNVPCARTSGTPPARFQQSTDGTSGTRERRSSRARTTPPSWPG